MSNNKTKSVPLSKFRGMQTHVVASLPGLKFINRVVYARKIEYYLVIPSVGDADARCIFIKKIDSWRALGWGYIQKTVEPELIQEETSRIARHL